MNTPRIAIVEDDDILSFLLAEVCKTAGWEVVGCVRNAPDALRLLADTHPEAVILDFALEGDQDGMDILDAVRSEMPQMKTILYTGWDYGKLRQRIDFVEPDHMLRKPVMPHELNALLAKLRRQIEAVALPHAA
ncbi:response regulator [Qipengyuania sphaerica]|uniref:response regulator n=1 Tax=Qipengyuania sphaerica TaxID=2867243 RepID=UPI001C87AC39|nr:response regulator [Qipengyuania sphaerica]MBX7541334.1 response regulator [Qipengyuania sphaerica]